MDRVTLETKLVLLLSNGTQTRSAGRKVFAVVLLHSKITV